MTFASQNFGGPIRFNCVIYSESKKKKNLRIRTLSFKASGIGKAFGSILELLSDRLPIVSWEVEKRQRKAAVAEKPLDVYG